MRITVLLLVLSCGLFGEIHFICTSALKSSLFEERKREYLRNLNALRSYGYDPWIIEATNIDHSFFDEVSSRVLYPRNHGPGSWSIGVHEARSIDACLPFLSFADEDVVIKMTGRYWMYDPTFIHTILEIRV